MKKQLNRHKTYESVSLSLLMKFLQIKAKEQKLQKVMVKKN